MFILWTRMEERKWRYAQQSASKVLHLMRAKKVNGVYDIQLGKDFRQYKTVWTGAKYDANEYGTKLIKSLVPNSKFHFQNLCGMFLTVYLLLLVITPMQ